MGKANHDSPEDEALRKEKAFTEAVLDSVPGLLYLYDSDGLLVRWNKQHERLTGYSAEELSQMHLLDWYKGQEEDIAAVTAGVERAMKEGFADAEANLKPKEGPCIPFYFTAVPLEIDGKIYFTGIGIDITRRKQAEMTIKENEAALSSIFRSAPAAIGIVSNRVIERCNDEIYNMLGFSEDEIIGKSVRILYPSDEEYERVGREVYGKKDKSERISTETRWRCKDGSLKDVLVCISAFKSGQESDRERVAFVAFDITELKKAQKMLADERGFSAAVLQTIAALVIVLDKDGRIVKFNRACEETTGYSFEELKGKRFSETMLVWRSRRTNRLLRKSRNRAVEEAIRRMLVREEWRQETNSMVQHRHAGSRRQRGLCDRSRPGCNRDRSRRGREKKARSPAQASSEDGSSGAACRRHSTRFQQSVAGYPGLRRNGSKIYAQREHGVLIFDECAKRN